MFTQSRNLRAALGAVAMTAALFTTQALSAPAPLADGNGWVIIPTRLAFPALVLKLEDSVKANKMGLVTTASASEGAKAQGIAIPGNRVVGVFRNDFARRMLAASIPAGIEAPIRFYLTEAADGTSILSYRKPGVVFAPYLAAAVPDLQVLANELDKIFEQIAADTTK